MTSPKTVAEKEVGNHRKRNGAISWSATCELLPVARLQIPKRLLSEPPLVLTPQTRDRSVATLAWPLPLDCRRIKVGFLARATQTPDRFSNPRRLISRG